MTPPNDHSRTGESAPLPTGTTRPRMPKPSDISAGVSDPYLVILASAGTGKTFQLTSRYLMLLRSGGPDRILASTFTRKAAHEIFDRVLVRLASAVLRDDELLTLQKHVGSPPITRDECTSLLELLSQQMHRVQIGTLDSLFSRLATSLTFELGFPPGWQLADSITVEQIKHRAIENVLRRAGHQDTRRLMHLLAKGDSTRRVHDLVSETVTNFMQAYLLSSRDAWDRIPPTPLLDPVTLNATILSLETLRCEDGRLQTAIAKSLEPVRRGAWDEFLVSSIPQRILIEDLTYYRKEIPSAVTSTLRSLIAHAIAWVRKIWTDQTRGTWETLDRVASEMNRLKSAERVFEYSDVTHRLAERLAGQGIPRVGFRLDASPDHLLLDEFQDTSLDQWQILRPFAKSTTSHRGHTFFVVGDRKQAIYGWRGGEAAIFDTIQQEFPVLKSRQLDESRRSAPAVIEAVNTAFESLKQTSAFDTASQVISEWCSGFPHHTTARQKLSGYVRLEVAAESDAENGRESKSRKSDRTEAVCQHTADLIARVVEQTPSATIGVLFRRNATIRQLATQLRERGVEFSEEGGTLIDDSAAVQLLMSLLRIADHPGDRIARFHVSQSPLAEIHALTNWEDDAAASRLSEHLRSRLLQDGYVNCLQRWSQQLGNAVTEHDRGRLRQLLELAEIHRPTTRVSDFIRLIEAQPVENPSTARVQLMTVHNSKGLQFDIVFLPELEVSLAGTPKVLVTRSRETSRADCVLVYKSRELRHALPEELRAAYDQTRDREINEALCLLYVAMTRAIHALYMILPMETSEKRKESLAGVLHEGLGRGVPLQSGAVLYETGDPNWWEHSSLRVASLHATAHSEMPLSRVEFAPLTGGRRRGLERVVPSQISGKATKVKLVNVLTLEESTGAGRGTLFHAWFERISWLDDQRPDENDLREIAARLETGDLNVDRCVSQFQSLLNLPEVAAVLSKRAYQSPHTLPFSPLVQAELAASSCEIDLDRERRFAVQVDGQMITGVIDRLVLLRRNGQVIAADIVDFKTDALPGRGGPNPEETATDAALTDAISAHRDQMRAYALAIGQIYRLPAERVSTRLVMLATGQVQIVEPSVR